MPGQAPGIAARRGRPAPLREARSYTQRVTSSALNASFEVLPLADLVLLLAANRSSGRLQVGGEQACELWLVDGSFTYAARVDEAPIGETLERQGIVSAADLATVGADGAALARSSGIDADRVRAAVHDRIVETLIPLLLAPDATFDFFDGEEHAFGGAFGLGVRDALTTARQRLDDWKAVAASIPSLGSTVTFASDLPRGSHEVRVPASDWPVLALIDGRRSVSDLVRDSGRNAYDVCMAVHRLVDAGAVSVTE